MTKAKPKPDNVVSATKSVNRLDQADFDLFVPALRNVSATAQVLQQAQQGLARAEANHTAAQGAMNYVILHLTPKYLLKEGDNIDVDGVITRKDSRMGLDVAF